MLCCQGLIYPPRCISLREKNLHASVITSVLVPHTFESTGFPTSTGTLPISGLHEAGRCCIPSVSVR